MGPNLRPWPILGLRLLGGGNTCTSERLPVALICTTIIINHAVQLPCPGLFLALDEFSRCSQICSQICRVCPWKQQVYRLYILEAELFPTYLEVSFNYPARQGRNWGASKVLPNKLIHVSTLLVQMHMIVIEEHLHLIAPLWFEVVA